MDLSYDYGNGQLNKRQQKKCRKTLTILALAASTHVFAAALCLAPAKYIKLLPMWSKQAKATVNMSKHRNRKGYPLWMFEI